jgi:PLP dependent protein
MADIKTNLSLIRQKIEAVDSQSAVRLVAVSKTKPTSDIMQAYDCGQRHFGENYIQELVDKAKELPTDINWHFIGTLQSNKCKLVASIPNLYLVETVDSVKKAVTLNKACSERSTRLGIMLQVNTSGEESKGGLEPSECIEAAKSVIETCPMLELKGLMTIGSVAGSAQSPNPDFECLKRCKAEIEQTLQVTGLKLSMGMSDDFETAIRQGSTNVRVGSSIFGGRVYAA